MLRRLLVILPVFGVLLVGCGKDPVTSKEPTSKPAASAPAKAPSAAPAKKDAC